MLALRPGTSVPAYFSARGHNRWWMGTLPQLQRHGEGDRVRLHQEAREGPLNTAEDHASRRVVLYARVSTERQASGGYSLAQQMEALREHAAREG
jgi:predicted site-specific integrase-resolvase